MIDFLRKLYVYLVCGSLLVSLSSWATTDIIFDTVINGGRVLDPETEFDALANVGISNGVIQQVTTEPLKGKLAIDAQGLIVAPGFIDILTQVESAQMPSARYKATDGVTTVLSMHNGPIEVGAMYDRMEKEGALLNYGTTIGQMTIRSVLGLGDFAGGEEGRNTLATPEQVAQILEITKRGIQEGAVGVGFGLQYTPNTTEEEVFQLFQLAAMFDVASHVHIRYLGPQRPTNSVKAIHEVIANAVATGASAHIAHVNSTSPKDINLVIRLLEGAKAHGVDISADAYPWGAGGTALESAVFDKGWQDRMAIDYSDLELVTTGERLTEESFSRYRGDGKTDWVIVHFIPESTLVRAYSSPLVMVASDGSINAEGKGHPRGAGTYARFFRRYVVEDGLLTPLEAARKTSYLAALRMQKAAPSMRRKGRISVGADADIVILDYDKIRERATYAEPAQTSEGIPWVFVNGVAVVENGKLNENAKPGRAIRGAP
ncbi:MAG: amidohydrolase family protein [Porticoccaceae bacterium]|jgi:hypothetical protein|nr:amidohydrolase family protein [Porticoccaceae bacterium]